MPNPTLSIRRELETALRRVMQANLSTITDIQFLIGREADDIEPVSIRLHVSGASPEVDEDLPFTGNYAVEGVIQITTEPDANTRTQHNEIEGEIEAWVTTDEAEFKAMFDDDDVTLWQWTPGDQEDGVEPETRRYATMINFSAVVMWDI